jgi:putative effector of murein hydrolase
MKILVVVVAGFYFTLLTTAGSVVGIRKLLSPKTDVGIVEDVDSDGIESTEAPSTATPAKAFSDELRNGLRLSSVASGVGALVASKVSSSLSVPLSALFMLLVTLHNFVFGARLPKSFTKVVHPLVTCTALTWVTATAFAAATGSKFTAMLRAYRTGTLNPLAGSGAGDVLLFLLGPAVVSLAISMYDRRKLMKENLREVVTAVGVSSVGGLFGTAAVVRLLQVASPYLRLALLSRNITSPLAMAIASILGADVSLAVAMVVVTGLIGANFGASILDSFGIKDPVARGLGIGAAAHGLGTAAFVNEEDAFPFAAISMALTATSCVCLVSVPPIKKMVLQLALGV